MLNLKEKGKKKPNPLCVQTKKAYDIWGKIQLGYHQTFQRSCFMSEENGIKYLRHSRKENVCQDFISSKSDFQVKRTYKFVISIEEPKKYCSTSLVKILLSQISIGNISMNLLDIVFFKTYMHIQCTYFLTLFTGKI